VTIEIHPVPGLPRSAGGRPGGVARRRPRRAGLGPEPGDVLVVTHKAVSKAEGAVAPLEGDEEAAYRRLVEEQSVEILRRRGSLVIAKTRHGFICANAGVDRSNAAPGTAVLLPADPDRSAHGLRLALRRITGVDVPVVITDTFGAPGARDWQTCHRRLRAGGNPRPARDPRHPGTRAQGHRGGRVDEIAAAADLAMGKAAGVPAALLRGLAVPWGEDGPPTWSARPVRTFSASEAPCPNCPTSSSTASASPPWPGHPLLRLRLASPGCCVRWPRRRAKSRAASSPG